MWHLLKSLQFPGRDFDLSALFSARILVLTTNTTDTENKCLIFTKNNFFSLKNFFSPLFLLLSSKGHFSLSAKLERQAKEPALCSHPSSHPLPVTSKTTPVSWIPAARPQQQTEKEFHAEKLCWPFLFCFLFFLCFIYLFYFFNIFIGV